MNNIVANGNVIFVFFNYNEYDENDTKEVQDIKCTKMSCVYKNPNFIDLRDFIKTIDVDYSIDFRNIKDVKCCNDYIKESCLNFDETIKYLFIDVDSNIGAYIKENENINKRIRIF